MNKYTITPENLSDMFCHACAAVVILEPLIEHKEKSSKAWANVVMKYFWKDGLKNEPALQISRDAEAVFNSINQELYALNSIYKTCGQLMQAIDNLPEGNIEIPLDHAIEIVYYSKQYEYMRNLYNVVACNRNGKKS